MTYNYLRLGGYFETAALFDGHEPMTVAKFGQSLARVEDRKLLTGAACYIDDISLPHIAHAFLVYSSHAHASIKSMDISRAISSTGVLAVITSEDVTSHGLGSLPPLFMPEDTGGPKGYRT